MSIIRTGHVPFPLTDKTRGAIIEALSPEAKLMLDAYRDLGVALVGTERSSMISYVDSEEASGNHSKKDYEVIFSLAGVNGLIDYVGGKVATAIANPLHNVNGYTLNGTTQYIKDNFIPNIDAVNFTQNDGFIGAFVKTSLENPAASVAAIWGTNLGAPDNIIRYNNDVLNMFTRHNDVASSTFVFTPTASGDYDILERNVAANYNIIRNGVLLNTIAVASTGLCSLEVYSGARNSGGTADIFFNGTLTTKIYSKSIGFNFLDNDTNLRTLLTTLGAIP